LLGEPSEGEGKGNRVLLLEEGKRVKPHSDGGDTSYAILMGYFECVTLTRHSG